MIQESLLTLFTPCLYLFSTYTPNDIAHQPDQSELPLELVVGYKLRKLLAETVQHRHIAWHISPILQPDLKRPLAEGMHRRSDHW